MTKKISYSHGTYSLEEYTDRTAEDLKDTFQKAESNIKVIANLSSSLMLYEKFDSKKLEELSKKSSFDGIGYIDSKGIATDMDGNTWNASRYVYFTRAKHGYTGCCLTIDSADKSHYLIYYTPIITDSNVVKGVLFGYYAEEYLGSKLKMTFWGYQSKSFLCNRNGNLIVTNTNKNKYSNFIDYFIDNNMLSEEEGKIILEKLRLEKIDKFTYHVGENDAQASIRQIGNNDIFLIEAFPDEAFRFLTGDISKIGNRVFLAFILVTAIFGFVAFLLMYKRQKSIEKESKRIKDIMEGANMLFSIVVVVDIENDSFECLQNRSKFFKGIPCEGKYDENIANLNNLYISGDLSKPVSDYFNSKQLILNLSVNKDRCMFEFCLGKSGYAWGEVHVMCLSRKNKIPNKVLITTVDITEAKRKQIVQKKLPELVFGTSFAFVGMINAKKQCITIQQNDRLFSNIKKKEVSYKKLIKEQENSIINSLDEEKFKYFTKLDYVEKELKENKKVEFTIHQMDSNGNIGIFKYIFKYFDSKKSNILCAVIDITEESLHDELTGLWNREGFVREAKKILKNSDEEYAFLHFDIKDFKAINSMINFSYGDEILKQFADKLLKSEIKPIVVCRSMADHFYCLTLKKNIIYSEISKMCKIQVEKAENKMFVYLHCGIFYPEKNQGDILKMCDNARLAEQTIINEYAMPYKVYESGMDDQYIENTQVLAQVENALKNGEFKTYYQPVFDAITKKIVSAEALVRWIHPKKGVISPGIFIPILEEKGYISKIDYHIFSSVNKFILGRINNNENVVPVSVNLSRMDFFNDDMMCTIVNNVENMSFEHKYIRFEVTESAFVDITNTGTYTIDRLHNLGSKILVDDFGTGSSSLGSLSNQTFDIIKLDMSFVKNIGKNRKSEAIIKYMISMCHEMNAEVIAEGVETKEQFNFLLENECDYIQGYYFSKPLSQEEFIKMLDSQQ